MRTRAIAATALVSAIALAGCGAGSDDTETETTDASTAAEQEETEEVTTEETTTEEASDYDFDAVDFGDPADFAAPGSVYTLGQVAWVDYLAAGEDGTVGSLGTVGLSVIDITAGEESFFEQYSNAEEFAGMVPYFIVLQAELTYPVSEADDPDLPNFWPIAADGTDLEYLTSGFTVFSGATDECGYDLPPFDAETGVAMWCMVGLGTPEQAVTGALFNGEGPTSFVATEGNPYAGSPLTWQG